MVISAPLIVKNESGNIAECLKSIRPFVDQIIVLDTGSTDDTPDICNDYADRVLYSAKFGPETPMEAFHFAEARNEVLASCSGDWVLSIDADERASGDPQKLRWWLAGQTPKNAYVPMRYQACPNHIAHLPRAFGREGTQWEGRYHDLPFPWDLANARVIPEDTLLLTNLSIATPEKRMRNIVLLKKEMYEDEKRITATTVKLADEYRNMGLATYPEAIGYYETMLAVVGRNRLESLAYVLCMVADCYAKLGAIAKARDICTRLHREFPAYQRGYVVAAQCYEALKEWDLAACYYRRCLNVSEPMPMRPYVDEPIDAALVKQCIVSCEAKAREESC